MERLQSVVIPSKIHQLWNTLATCMLTFVDVPRRDGGEGTLDTRRPSWKSRMTKLEVQASTEIFFFHLEPT